VSLGSLGEYRDFAGLSSTDATRDASLATILAGVEAAIKKLCSPFLFEAATLTDLILDAPWASPYLLLPAVPVRSVTSLYYRQDARGVAGSFTSDDLLTAGTDYQLVIDDPVNNWSRAGRVRRLTRSVWGVSYERPLGRLGFNPTPEAGSIKATLAVGCTVVPAEVTQALYLATSLVYQRRQKPPVSNEGWNGYSVGYAAPFTATAAIHSPDVYGLLLPYVTQIRVGV
jgi:hypothetical protein